MSIRLTTSQADMRRNRDRPITHQSMASSGRRRLRTVATPAVSSAVLTSSGSNSVPSASRVWVVLAIS
ncbi:hypothetical protein D3C80_1638870 [compost metagenome]